MSSSKDGNEATLDDAGLSKLDQQIREARKRKQSRGEAVTAEAAPAAEKKAGRKVLSDEERALRDAAREKERAERKVVRDAEREARRAEKAAAAKPAHMAKVEKAASNLPQMSDNVVGIFRSISGSSDLALTDVETLVANLNHFVRTKRTQEALQRQLVVGQVVTIVGGDSRFIGSVGRVEKVQRIRCYVAVNGQEKPVYLFTSDVEPLEGGESLPVDEASNDVVPQAANG